MAFKKENKFEIRYVLKSAYDNDVEKVIRIDGDRKKDEILRKIEEVGYRLVSCEKLYPFSLPKEAHNIDLAYNAHFNMCHAMETGDMPWDDSAFEALADIREVRDIAFGSYDPILWVPGKVFAKLHEWAFWAKNYREDANNEWKKIRDEQ